MTANTMTAFHPLLKDIDWDGAILTLAFSSSIGACSAVLDLDGCFFTELALNGATSARFHFPFSPSGHTDLLVQPRLARNGIDLTREPLLVRHGCAGLFTVAQTMPALLAPVDSKSLLAFATDAITAEVVIIIPVYNAPALVECCLDSVLIHTTGRARLIVIDDASPDPAIRPLLARYADRPGITILHNERNFGFTATVNRGITLADTADVVLLNADAEVGPNWLTGLRRAAYLDENIGTATAVSNAAGAFSVPELEQANAFPPQWTFTQTARALWQHAGLIYPALPTGNGFCMYIRHAVLDRIGLFDVDAFPQGYGEENDFCQRAEAVGFRHLIAGNVLARHARSASFGETQRESLGKAGMAVLRERYPHYEAAVGATLFSFERRVLDWRVRRIYHGARLDNAPQPRVLKLVESQDVCAEVSGYEVWNVSYTNDELVLRWKCAGGNEVIASKIDGDEQVSAILSYEQTLWAWLQRYAIELVDIPASRVDVYSASLSRLSTTLGIPVVNSAPSDNGVDHYVQTFIAAQSFV